MFLAPFSTPVVSVCSYDSVSRQMRRRGVYVSMVFLDVPHMLLSFSCCIIIAAAAAV